jgi:predicted Zn-dependent peptidase
MLIHRHRLPEGHPYAHDAIGSHQPPEVKSATLSNGLQSFVVERRDLPKVSMRVRFRIGVAHNPAGKEGLALVTLGSAKRGTRSGAQIEREVTDMATSIQAAADADSMSTGFDV